MAKVGKKNKKETTKQELSVNKVVEEQTKVVEPKKTETPKKSCACPNSDKDFVEVNVDGNNSASDNKGFTKQNEKEMAMYLSAMKNRFGLGESFSVKVFKN